MRLTIARRQFRSIVAGGVLAGMAFWGVRVLRASRLGSLGPSRKDDERSRLLAEKTSDLVCLHEPDGRYLYISPSCRRLLGYESEPCSALTPTISFTPKTLSVPVAELTRRRSMDKGPFR